MDANQNQLKTYEDLSQYNALTEKIIGCVYQVSNTLGPGFLEKVYENALAHEFEKAEIPYHHQMPLKVWYDGVVVGEYQADFMVNDCVLIELKAVKALDEIHEAQCVNYLKATKLRLCLLINFGTRRVQIKRLAN